MSRTIDQRVVEMQFDNSNFEKNVDKSLSTLDKLKAALHLGNSVDEFDEVETATQRLGKSIGVFEEIATGALRRFGASVEDWAARTVRAMSGVDNVFEGFSKFGRMTESTGTLVAQGFALEEVEAQVNRLRWFSDETSYSLTDMTENISKFTATGKNLEDSSDAMMGIALWAALSGKNAGEASRAMYQLSQAMSAGKMRLEDYKSIQNLSMDTREFRQIALDTGVALGTLKKNADGLYHTINPDSGYKDWFSIDKFAETLTTGGWMNDEVQMATYRKYGSAINDIYNYVQENGVTASEAIEQLGGSIDAFGLKAFKAGGEARTWAQTIDSVKDGLSSGWAQIFQYIFGNYDQAVSFYTALANKFYDLFVEPVNGLVEAFSAWNGAGGRTLLVGGIMDGIDAIQGMADGLGETFDRVFFTGDPNAARKVFGAALDAPAKQMRQMEKDAADASMRLGKDVELYSEEENIVANKAQAMMSITKGFRSFIDLIVDANAKSDGFMRAVGGIFAIFNIAKQAVSGFVEGIKPLFSGAGTILEWFFNKLGNLGDWFVKLSQNLAKNNTLGKFFTTFFKPLLNIKDNLASFKDAFLPEFTERWNKFKASLKGRFSDSSGATGIQKILADIKSKWENLFTNFDAEKAVDGVFKAWEKLKELLRSMFGIQEGGFADWAVKQFNKASEGMSTFWENTKKYLGGAWDTAVEYFEKAKNWIETNWDSIIETAKKVTSTIKEVFGNIWEGIKKPFAGKDGGNVLDGIITMLKDAASIIGYVIGEIVSLFEPLVTAIKNTLGTMDADNAGDWIKGGGLLAIGFAIKKFADNFAENDLVKAIANILDGVSGVLNSFAHSLDAKALKEAAVGVAIIVASLFLLVGLDPASMVTAALAMETVVMILARSLKKLSGFTKEMKLGKEGLTTTKSSGAGMILAAAISMVLIAEALRIIAKIPTNDLYTAATVMSVLMVVMTFMLKAMSKIGKGDKKVMKSKNIASGNIKIGNKASLVKAGPAATIFSIAVFFIAVWFVLKQMIDIIKTTDTGVLISAIGIMVGALVALVFASEVVNEMDTKKGNWLNVLAVAAAVAIIAEAFGSMIDAIGNAKAGAVGSAILTLTLIMGALVAITAFAGNADFSKSGKLTLALLGMALAIGAVAYIVGLLAKAFNGVKNEAIDGAVSALMWTVIGLLGAVGVLALLTSKCKKLDTNTILKMSAAMVIISAAVAIAAAAAYGFSKVDEGGIKKAGLALVALIAAVAALGALGGYTKIGDGFEKFGKGLMYIGGAVGLVGIGFLAAAEGMRLFGDEQTNVKQAAKNISEFIDEVLVKLPGWTTKALSAIIETAFALIPGAIIGLIDSIIETLDALLEGDRLKKLIEKLCSVAEIVLDGLIENAPTLVEKVGELLVKLLESLGSWATTNSDEIAKAIHDFLQGIWNVIVSFFDGIGTKIFGDAWEEVKTAITEFGTWLVGAAGLGLILTKLTTFATDAVAALSPLTNAIGGIAGGLGAIKVAAIFANKKVDLENNSRHLVEMFKDSMIDDMTEYYYRSHKQLSVKPAGVPQQDWEMEHRVVARQMAIDAYNNGYRLRDGYLWNSDTNTRMELDPDRSSIEVVLYETKDTLNTGFSEVERVFGDYSDDSLFELRSLHDRMKLIESKGIKVTGKDLGGEQNNYITINMKGDQSPVEVYRVTVSAMGRFMSSNKVSNQVS